MSSGSGAAIADWALPPNGKPPGDDQNLWDRITAWWAEFTLQTKLLAIATLVVSLMMTGITFFALNGIQRDAVMNDTRYARDLGLLLAGNVTELVHKTTPLGIFTTLSSRYSALFKLVF
jgi:two-component system sensor histidine kinase NblS